MRYFYIFILTLILISCNEKKGYSHTPVIEFGEGQDALLRQELVKLRFTNFVFHRDLDRVNRVLCVKNNT